MHNHAKSIALTIAAFATGGIVVGAAQGLVNDWSTFLGNFSGGALGASAAIFVFLFTVSRRNQDREDELGRLKRAIYQDLRSTLPGILDDYRYWSHLTIETIKQEPMEAADVEHLKPTVFDATLDRVGQFTDEEAEYLLLIHDNLRSARDAIRRFWQEAPRRLHQAQDNPRARQRAEAFVLKRAGDIAETLSQILQDTGRALQALDPNGVIEATVEALLKNREGGAEWLSEMQNKYQLEETHSSATPAAVSQG